MFMLQLFDHRVKEHLLTNVVDRVSSTVQPAVPQTASSSSNDESLWTNIKDEPLKMCNFTTENLTNYFVYLREADGLERQDWKSLNSGGYRLFSEGHIQDVCIKNGSGACFVKAECLPEMKKDRKYVVYVKINKESCDVNEATCSCPAGRGPLGSCKHIAALCFSLENFVKTRDVSLALGEGACTAALQKWNQPRKRRLDSVKAEEISFKSTMPSYAEKENKRSERKAYDPRPLCMRSTSTSELEEFRERVKELPNGTGFLHLLHKSSHAISTEAVSTLPLTPQSVQCCLKHKLYSMPLPPSLSVLQELGEEFLSDITPNNQQKCDTEKATCLQANCVHWHEEHYCRLTASNFGAVVKRKSAHATLANSILSSKVLSCPFEQ